jgi:protein-tyrosine-phosphatase
MKKILIVGMGNTCRSIVAAEYLKKALKDRGNTGILVFSAGVRAFPDIPADNYASDGLKSLGIEGEFRSRALSRQDVTDASLIITMSPRIKSVIAGKFGEKADFIFTIKEISGEAESEITASDKLAGEIKAMIDKGYDKIAGV